MINFEKSIVRAIPKVRKNYAKEWIKEVREAIYVELDTITINYEYDCTWAEVKVRWGRTDEKFPFDRTVTFVVYPRHIKHLVGYILGAIAAVEDAEDK